MYFSRPKVGYFLNSPRRTLSQKRQEHFDLVLFNEQHEVVEEQERKKKIFNSFHEGPQAFKYVVPWRKLFVRGAFVSLSNNIHNLQ